MFHLHLLFIYVVDFSLLAQVINGMIILSEFREFRAIPDECLPTLDFPTTDSSGIESFWMAMSEITLSDQTIYRFGNLNKLCKILLVLIHGNADPERLFSMISNTAFTQELESCPAQIGVVRFDGN